MEKLIFNIENHIIVKIGGRAGQIEDYMGLAIWAFMKQNQSFIVPEIFCF